MLRCNKCILPANYPGIKFNKNGICNYCADHKQKKYLGEKALKEKILSHLKNNENRDYDCVLGFSGGRDSSYLLYYLVIVLNLRVLAFTVDNGFIPEQTITNVERISNLLNVDLVIEKKDYLQKCIRHHISSWLTNPSIPMIGVLCTGCRLAIAKSLHDIAVKYNIPTYISGGTPFEGMGYKTNILRSNPESKKNNSLMFGYISQIVKNPKWIGNLYCVTTQFLEFRARYGQYYIKKMKKKGIQTIKPYYAHIRWEEKKVISTIENKLNWKKNPLIESTWRGDCDIALLKLYLYKKLLGFNDKDDGLSALIRDGQISRKEALVKLEQKSHIPEIAIKNILNKVGLTDFTSLVSG